MDGRLVIAIFVAARATDRTPDRVGQSGAKKRMHEAIDGFEESDREESSPSNDAPAATEVSRHAAAKFRLGPLLYRPPA